ncbi:response regulator transcription factor [Evansella cellulosilytica]|uniref:Two component transcriptional regulator, winged helix family n=1 Tax=Evansella cellulosilytica (strain ATCC 21833 / DSM 2522 / FERM P-1141 / JCM 9156 / N-4) TaxID=649639 RepID=E6U019_EVAC2|nr:response regulator transcription factor [Evansella cellulosilytica]ADU29023.1 two component transcriptional regulator, winged helix family [Evansella cellulosilytica DSM 2522]
MKEKVLIIEDDEDIRELTALYLKKHSYEVFTAKDGYEGINIVQNNNPHLVLLDILLPGMKGYEICQKIRMLSEAPIIFLSCKRDIRDKVKGLDAGADDYLTKPFDFTELEARIKANLRRSKMNANRNEPKRVFSCGNLEIDLDSYDVFNKGNKVSLYTKELQLLMLLVENKNHVFSAEKIYDQIWGIDHCGDLKTVMVHISNLRRKIEENPSKPKLIKTVRGFGYKFSTADEDIKG